MKYFVKPQGEEKQNKQDIEFCIYRTENSECELTNDDCFPDDIPWSCPLRRERGAKKGEQK